MRSSGLILIIAVIGVVGAGIFKAGLTTGVQGMKQTLTTDGYAEYYLDENNSKQWRMKPLKGGE